MGLIKKVVKVFTPIYKEDPFFGRLCFQRAGFWEGKKYFAPERREYELTIDGGDDRPTESQSSFYRTLETRYATLKPEIAKALLAQLCNWQKRSATRDVWNEFTLESFGIPDVDAGEQEWELVYELKEDGHLFCVAMNGWKIEGIRIDG
ncbi:MAG: hypothetical protein ACREOO_24645 [bacterium]